MKTNSQAYLVASFAISIQSSSNILTADANMQSYRGVCKMMQLIKFEGKLNAKARFLAFGMGLRLTKRSPYCAVLYLPTSSSSAISERQKLSSGWYAMLGAFSTGLMLLSIMNHIMVRTHFC